MSAGDVKLKRVRAIATAFDAHDLAAIMEHFIDDCVFEAPRGSEAFGRRVVGRAAVRQAFADRFAGIPDVRYTDDSHFVSGDRGVSEWLLSGTTAEGERIEVRGTTSGPSRATRSRARTPTGRSAPADRLSGASPVGSVDEQSARWMRRRE